MILNRSRSRKTSVNDLPAPEFLRVRLQKRRGAVLLVVLMVVVILSLSAYSYTALMVSQREAVRLSGRQIQSRALVDSGVEAIKMFLAQEEQTIVDSGGTYDNAEHFQGILVRDDVDPNRRGRFTVTSTALDEEGRLAGLRYGLTDESIRLNLNALMIAEEQQEDGGKELLKALPAMTDEIAESILDWIDEDDDPRPLGAEVDYYSSLAPAYAPKNGPLESVEELLLVRGVTPQLLFGMDVNRNGMIDAQESANASFSIDDPDLDLGWSAFLTLYSQEKNETLDGEPRVYVNGEDMEQLYNEVKEAINAEWATFIVAYRQFGPYTGTKEGEPYLGGDLDFEQEGKVPLVQVLDLVDAKVRVRFEGDDESTILNSPIQSETIGFQLPQLMDHLSVNASPIIPGRININQAPRTILLGIPGMDEAIVDDIISHRDEVPDVEDAADENRRFETWILAELIVELDKMREILPYVNAGGDVFRGQVVGYFDGGGATSRAEVVFDAIENEPRILLWRDISHLGSGYSLETLGTELVE